MLFIIKAAWASLANIAGNRQVLRAVVKVDFQKKYAGSAFGMLWLALHPMLLLAIYLFVYMVVFKMRFPGYSEYDFVLYVFCGLIPYIGLMESIGAGVPSIKQNIHLVKNVMIPIEIVPLKAVAVGMATQIVGLAILLAMGAIGGVTSFHLLWLPLVVLLQVMFILGIVWVLAAVNVTIPDVGYFVNLLMLFLIFVSPIGFKPEMVPEHLRFIVTLNPVYYMAEMFRHSILYGTWPTLEVAGIFVAMSFGTFAVGAAFFAKFKTVLIDYE